MSKDDIHEHMVHMCQLLALTGSVSFTSGSPVALERRSLFLTQQVTGAWRTVSLQIRCAAASDAGLARVGVCISV